MTISVTGIPEAKRAFQKLDRLQRQSHFAALAKTATYARGKIRRDIVSREGVKLNTTAKRVKWFWQGARNSAKRDIKLWVGTKYRQFPSKGDKLKPDTEQPAKVDITDTAQISVPTRAKRAMRSRYPVLLRQQLTRKLRSF